MESRNVIRTYAIYHRSEADIEFDRVGAPDETFNVYEDDDETAIIARVQLNIARDNKRFGANDRLAEVDTFEGAFLNWV